MKKLLTLALSLSTFPAFSVGIDNNSTPAVPAVSGANTLKVVTTTTQPGVATVPKFRLVCKYSAGGVFDPIVYPGQANAGHHHTFFGNPTVTKDSTSADLNASNISNCAGGTMNRSAYWVPSIYSTVDGKIIKPFQTIVYYATVRPHNLTVNPIPDGLKMIAPIGHSSWECTQWPNPNYGSGATIPTCTTSGHKLRAFLTFPSCWDGINLDSANHHSHMAYDKTGDYKTAPAQNGCPSSHPVRIAGFKMIVDWDVVAGGETANWRLSSDSPTDLPGATFHGDYMEGWTQKYMDMIVNNCLKADKDCGVGLLGIDPDDGLYKKTLN